MREIKFRAWDRDGEEMIGPNDFYQNADELPNGRRTGCHLSDFFNLNEDGTVGKEHENIVFMQFTGLLDKNGKEIYEGDIVDFAGLKPLKIVWRNAAFEAPLMPYENSNPIVLTPEGFERFADVIGNIYENKDLLQ